MILKHQHDVDYVMVGGGDGSINLVLPTLIQTQIPLLLLPLGTANNLARTFTLPKELSLIQILLYRHYSRKA